MVLRQGIKTVLCHKLIDFINGFISSGLSCAEFIIVGFCERIIYICSHPILQIRERSGRKFIEFCLFRSGRQIKTSIWMKKIPISRVVCSSRADFSDSWEEMRYSTILLSLHYHQLFRREFRLNTKTLIHSYFLCHHEFVFDGVLWKSKCANYTSQNVIQ